MAQFTKKYQYSQLEKYKEHLELQHLKLKTIIVNMMMFLISFVVLYFLIRLDVQSNSMIPIMLLFYTLIIINITFYSYDGDQYNNLRIAMYINTMGVYIATIVLILQFQTPSIFTSLFIAYAVTAIYQDYKAMLLSSGLLFFAGLILLSGYSEIFTLVGNASPQEGFIIAFLVIFVLLLTLSSFILIKRKTFFYNQLAQIKESEVRNMKLLMKIEKIKTNKELNSEKYYSSLLKFTEILSEKLEIENIFSDKIMILKDSRKMSFSELLGKYNTYSKEEILEILELELETHEKMEMIGIKASKSINVNVDRKEMFSEAQFKSFKHEGDHRYIKIISFVVFYTMLKIEKPYLKSLTEEEIKDILFNSEYYYRIDRDIINIYLDNNQVFDTIVKDIMKGE
ncbi:MAG: hypothetical protein ACVCEJ_05355 [Candidatus Izemoplasmataceae bacterium]